MDEALEVRLRGGRQAPGLARTALSGLNGSLAELHYPVSLLVSELVTNAVRHGGTGPESTVCVRLDSTGRFVRVEVVDGGPGFDGRPGRPKNPIQDGFGLVLVDELADRWGVEANDDETLVWFEIDRPHAR